MDDLISRQAVMHALEKCHKQCCREDGVGDEWIHFETAENEMECIPSVQPETAKRIVGKSRGGMTLWYQCEMCNEPVDAQDNFCRGCGRRLIDEID